MANIESVKLPNGTQYDIKDNISGYAHKIASPTADNLVTLTASGDIADSGIAKSDVIQSNPNLLDNPFFTVNERGVTSWASGGFVMDRWVGLNISAIIRFLF